MINYWIKAYKNPSMIMGIISRKSEKLRLIFSMNLVIAVLLAITSLLRHFTDFSSPFKQLLDLEVGKYYLWQSIYAIPFVLLVWIMCSGLIYMLSMMGKAASRRYFFDDALVVMTFGIVLPWLILVIVPNLLIYPFTGVLLTKTGELIRCIIMPFIWQTFIITIGINQLFQVKWKKSCLVAMLTAVVFMVMVIIFIR